MSGSSSYPFIFTPYCTSLAHQSYLPHYEHPYTGLNADQYAVTTIGVAKERQLGVLDSQVPDSERFRDTDPLTVNCPKCSAVSPFFRLTEDQVRPSSISFGALSQWLSDQSHMYQSMILFQPSILTPTGPQCPSCNEPIPSASIELQLDLQIHQHVSRYYEAWMVCDDPTCEMRTRRMSVKPRKCMRSGCHGNAFCEVRHNWFE